MREINQIANIKCCPSWAHEFTPAFFGGVRVAHLFIFLCCPITCLYVLGSMFWCPLRFPHKTLLGSSLPPVVYRRTHVLLTLIVFVCVNWCPTYIVLWFCFLFVFLRHVYPMLSVSLDFPFLIDSSVFSNVLHKNN